MKKILLFLTLILGVGFGIAEVDAKTVTFKDKNLCDAVYMTATEGGVSQAHVIHNNCSASKSVVFDRDEDFNRFDSFVISKNYTSYSGLEKFDNLNKINIYMGDDFNKLDFNKLSSLASLISSIEINCNTECSISNFDKITSFTNIRVLKLYGANVSLDIIGQLSGLNILTIHDVEVSDTTFISNLIGLTELNLVNTNISDISFLSNFTSLRKLDLTGNPINNISVIKNMTSLTNINISDECNVQINNGDQLNIDGNKCSVKTELENNVTKTNDNLNNKAKDLDIITLLVPVGVAVLIAGVSIAVMLRKKNDNN